ncbi:MAG TPA: tetratricopeptide repeat protein [Methylotenera sp.]|nr:tetratricopeptide repeat protein [Methylotenera sp.]HPV44494.1 tetratricopeptide repeat protein [Methylotenera sp.]
MTSNKVGRNDSCPCGSGKKYKHCCEQTGTITAPMQSAPTGLSVPHALQTAMMHHQAGNLSQAEMLYKQVLQAAPNQHDALHLLGLIAKQKGDHKTAIQLMRKALALNPDYIEAYVNLGATLQEQNSLTEAADCYRKALALRSNYAEVHSNLGVVLKAQDNMHEAAASFLRAIELKPDFAEAFANLDALLKEMSEPAEALTYYRKVLAIVPALIAAQQGAYLALSRTVPEWHVPMMNEQNRNQAYFDALKSVVKPDSTVFEIGTGSGLLAMMSAKLGAKQVNTCEAVPLIAETAQQIVKDNKFEKIIKVIAKKSIDIEVGNDLPEQADILVSEIFSSELLGEYVLPSLEDAKRRLLKPQGKVIPAAGSIMIGLFTGDDIRRNLIVEDSFGFNLQHFNTIVSNKRMIARNDLDIELLSDGIEAFDFDFENESYFPSQSKSLRIPIKSAGRCYGIVQWMRLDMTSDKKVVFENHPSQTSKISNWQQCAYLFDAPVDVKLGQVAVISAAHNRAVPWFFLDHIE